MNKELTEKERLAIGKGILKAFTKNVKGYLRDSKIGLTKEEKAFPENKYYDQGMTDSIKILKMTLGLPLESEDTTLGPDSNKEVK